MVKHLRAVQETWVRKIRLPGEGNNFVTAVQWEAERWDREEGRKGTLGTGTCCADDSVFCWVLLFSSGQTRHMNVLLVKGSEAKQVCNWEVLPNLGETGRALGYWGLESMVSRYCSQMTPEMRLLWLREVHHYLYISSQNCWAVPLKLRKLGSKMISWGIVSILIYFHMVLSFSDLS